MPRALRLAVGCFALGFVGLFGSEGCRTPTQITVELRTFGALSCTSLKGVAIVVARTREDAEARMSAQSFSAEVPRGVCDADGRTIGTLVVTPQGATGAIIVRARFLENNPKDPAKGTIIARRAFAFIDHASVTLPITLEVACVDVPCDVTSSCHTGTCVSSDATCSESSGTCDSPAEPVVLDSGVSPPSDGAPADGSPVDAPADAPRDVGATVDAADAGTGAGNLCPRTVAEMGPIDCHPLASANYCCREFPGRGYHCGQAGVSCGAAEDKFECTGLKGCDVAGQFCCGSPPGPGPLSSTCSTTCLTGGDHFLCNTASDCPKLKPFCNVIYSAGGPGGPLEECSATP